MSIIRCLSSDPRDFYSLPTLFDQHFGHGMRLSDLSQPMYGQLHSSYLRPWRRVSGPQSGTSEMQMDKDSFKVVMDVQQFSPEELTVKVADGCLVVEGKHEEKEDEHGYVSRHFVRRYRVPEGVQLDAVTSTLSSDGVLCVTAPKQPETEDNFRCIPITVTNVPAVKNTKECPAEKNKEELEKKG